LPKPILHALRHAHASQLIDADIDIVTISKRLGYASPSVTLQVYADLLRRLGDKVHQVTKAAMARFGTSW
jgi:integrase